MAPKILIYLLAAATAIITSSAIAVPETVLAPFVIPDDAEILDLRSDEEKALGKRANGGIYLCKGINFDANQGCRYAVLSWGNATSLTATDYNDVISSAGTDVGTTCELFADLTNGACAGLGSLLIGNLGISDFRNHPRNNGQGTWNDVVSCIKCWY